MILFSIYSFKCTVNIYVKWHHIDQHGLPQNNQWFFRKVTLSLPFPNGNRAPGPYSRAGEQYMMQRAVQQRYAQCLVRWADFNKSQWSTEIVVALGQLGGVNVFVRVVFMFFSWCPVCILVLTCICFEPYCFVVEFLLVSRKILCKFDPVFVGDTSTDCPNRIDLAQSEKRNWFSHIQPRNFQNVCIHPKEFAERRYMRKRETGSSGLLPRALQPMVLELLVQGEALPLVAQALDMAHCLHLQMVAMANCSLASTSYSAPPAVSSCYCTSFSEWPEYCMLDQLIMIWHRPVGIDRANKKLHSTSFQEVQVGKLDYHRLAIELWWPLLWLFLHLPKLMDLDATVLSRVFFHGKQISLC